MARDEDGVLVAAHKVNGECWQHNHRGEELIQRPYGNDVRAPITAVPISAKPEDGKTVEIVIVNNDGTTVRAEIT